jgi:hypothetical protein
MSDRDVESSLLRHRHISGTLPEMSLQRDLRIGRHDQAPWVRLRDGTLLVLSYTQSIAIGSVVRTSHRVIDPAAPKRGTSSAGGARCRAGFRAVGSFRQRFRRRAMAPRGFFTAQARWEQALDRRGRLELWSAASVGPGGSGMGRRW